MVSVPSVVIVERNGQRFERKNDEYHEPTQEPKDFSDELDKMDF